MKAPAADQRREKEESKVKGFNKVDKNKSYNTILGGNMKKIKQSNGRVCVCSGCAVQVECSRKEPQRT